MTRLCRFAFGSLDVHLGAMPTIEVLTSHGLR
jgi:hypothetical protein